ncbi:MAG: DUF1329 domain-containing protein [Deltaproteobacteria bacterium]|nr:DUF1329 domain-containing protein [Deltaproteobacteria bacterium]
MIQRAFFTALLLLLAHTSGAEAQDPALPLLTPSAQEVTLPEAGEGSAAGTLINAGNAKAYKALIVPELYPLVRANLIELDAVKGLRYRPSSTALQASAQEAAISGNGEIAEPPIQLSPGMMFPSIDVADKNATWKVLWNLQSRLWSQQFIENSFVLSWLQGQKLTRQLGGRLTRVYPKALSEGDKSIQLFREKIELIAPGAVKGFTWLSFRFFGPEEDMLWLYSPVVERSRQLTGTNRSDAILKTSVAPDDFLAWSGKVELVEPKQIRKIKGLVFFPSVEPVALKQGAGACMEWAADNDPSRSAIWNYQSHKYSQAFGWVPTASVAVPRDLWRIEMISRDPYSAYGRQVLYIDAELFVPVYKFIYNRAGYLWKIVAAAYAQGVTSGGARQIILPHYTIVDDLIAKSAYIIESSETKICSGYPSGVKISDFDPQKLAPPKP